MLNLLPKKEKNNNHRRFLTRLFLVYALFFFLTLIISIILLFPIYFLLSTKHQAISDHIELTKKEEISTDVDKFKEIINEFNKKIKIINRDINKKVTPSKLVKIITNNTNGDIKINGIFYDRTKKDEVIITIRGLASKRESLQNFVQSIEKEKYLSASLPISNLIQDKNISFSVVIDVLKNN